MADIHLDCAFFDRVRTGHGSAYVIYILLPSNIPVKKRWEYGSSLSLKENIRAKIWIFE